MFEFEQNLMKMWIFLNHYSFGKNSLNEEKALMVEIKNSFKSDGYESYLKPSLEINKITSLISELNKKLSKEQKKIFEELKNCSIERVENGGSHRSL